MVIHIFLIISIFVSKITCCIRNKVMLTYYHKKSQVPEKDFQKSFERRLDSESRVDLREQGKQATENCFVGTFYKTVRLSD